MKNESVREPNISQQTKARPRPLTDRQRLFIELYLKYGNASRAAREAGYSEKTAYSIGHENLRKPAIKAIVDECSARQHEEFMNALRLKQQQFKGYVPR